MGVETIAIAALAAGGISTAVSVMGAYEQGQAQKRNADYQAKVADMNATISKQNANYEMALGEQRNEQQQTKAKAAVGSIVANQGANGLDVNSGSNLAVQTGAEEMGALDSQTIKNNATRTAYNYQVQATEATAQGQLDRAEGSQAQLSSYLNMGSSLLGGASSVGDQYIKYNQVYGLF
jgi:hypothetical protein